MKREEILNAIGPQVEEYLNTNWLNCGIPHNIMVDEDKRNHIVRCGTEIMGQKSGFELHPGSFVTSVVENNLASALLKADSINQFALKFYVTMMLNLQINLK